MTTLDRLRRLAALATLLTAACSAPAPDATVPFPDRAAGLGLVHAVASGGTDKVHIRESLGQGGCWTDYDGDGDLDLLLLDGGRQPPPSEGAAGPWRFYARQGPGFVEVGERVGLAGRAWGVGCAVGDADGDGLDDLFVTVAGGANRLFRNLGVGRFEDVTDRAGVGDPALSVGAAFADLDGDGDLDLAVARYLDEASLDATQPCRWKGTRVMCGPKAYSPLPDVIYRNLGDGRFEDVSSEVGVAEHAGYGMGIALFDADLDGDVDLFVANDSSPNHFFLNDGRGGFHEQGFERGLALSDRGQSQASMGVDAGDLNGDGRTDLVVSNFSDDVNNVLLAAGPVYSESSHRSGAAAASLAMLGWAMLLEDVDLDGDLDLFTVNGHVYPEVDEADPATTYRQPLQLLLNDGAGRWTDELHPGPGPTLARSAALADVDADGDADFLVVRDGASPWLLENDLAAADHHWIGFRLRGSQPGNRAALGAHLRFETEAGSQWREHRPCRGYLGCGDAVVRFGTGRTTRGRELEVTWPSGRRHRYRSLPVDRTWQLEEGR